MKATTTKVHNPHADWSAHDWAGYFRQRRATRPPLPWENGPQLTPEEQRSVLGSIAIFQRGETGEGRHFLRVGRQHAADVGDPEYVDALTLFIAEEGDHASLLKLYLEGLDYACLTRNWTDFCFRWLRHQAGLELTITVLLTAEVIAMVYYAALRRATHCPLLRGICSQILEDEVFHLKFQGDRLGRLYALHSPAVAAIHRALHRGLLECVWRVVWWTHRPVFQRADLRFREGRSRLRGQFRILMGIAAQAERRCRTHAVTRVVECAGGNF